MTSSAADAPAPGTIVRVAAIDMGSNTTRLMVADVHVGPDGALRLDPLVRRTTITRLAEDVDRRGILLPQAITRTRSALVDYRRELGDAGAVFALATATSAVRDADNGEAFLGEVEHGFGFRALLLDGMEEAATTWAGVTSDDVLRRRASTGTGLLLDIGGGSTEVVLTTSGEPVDQHSFQLGSVRLTEQELPGDGPTSPAALDSARQRAAALLGERFPRPAAPDVAIGVAGTVTTVAAMALEMGTWDADRVHGTTLTPRQVADAIDRLAAMSVEDRRSVVGLEPERAPVILGGLVILEQTLRHFGIDTMVVSVRDILDGIALRAARMALAEGITELPEPFGRTVC
jgi:exopolyphosphatase / guanosine-5'-triphosphate,3'-diphosphate pyrophosphatase